MKSEELRLQLTIETSTATRDTAGGQILSWATFATVRAAKKHSSSREFYAAQKINSEITDLYTIRYRTGINAKMRGICDGKTYDILGANDPDGKRREIYILCKVVE